MSDQNEQQASQADLMPKVAPTSGAAAKPGRPRKYATEAERIKAKADRQRERRLAAGGKPKPGRPPKYATQEEREIAITAQAKARHASQKARFQAWCDSRWPEHWGDDTIVGQHPLRYKTGELVPVAEWMRRDAEYISKHPDEFPTFDSNGRFLAVPKSNDPAWQKAHGWPRINM
jgi:hypothetical protein